MARPSEGWRLRPHRVTGIQQVRFTHAGVQREISTGERDPGAAATEAARIYAEVISGRWDPLKTGSIRPGTPLDEAAADWLESLEGSLDVKTIEQYEMYVVKLWTPFFETVDRVTTPSATDYIRHRLRQVIRRTLQKELSGLRGFMRWCEEPPRNRPAVFIPPPPAKAAGTPSTRPHKVGTVPLEPGQVAKILASLPVMSVGRKGRKGFPVRARFIVAWETGLRPATLDEIRAPEDYRRGARRLKIRDEADKARFGREVPLTPEARAALNSVLGEPGLIFGKHKYRDLLKEAGRAAGLSKAHAKDLSPYDFRHARGTFLTESSGGNLPGVAFLFGHKHVTTTAIYVHGSRKAAERVLASGGFKGHSRGKKAAIGAKEGN